MKKIEQEGELPAFPFEDERFTYWGLTKREHFAGLAMLGLLALPAKVDNVAGRAVEYADALLLELAKTSPAKDSQ